VPLTRGDVRGPIDILLYAALLVMLVVGLASPGSRPLPGLDTATGALPVWEICTILAILGALGLRDKTIFLAARGEVYGALCV
ncbi:DUF3556 domain-containing protein, partial [Mycobacterium tuberculosis]|nr:DUF3556 domain-containing protein [Mycobacterium tuberculosis]